jgi:F-type H+-transporting ATPase subunit b
LDEDLPTYKRIQEAKKFERGNSMLIDWFTIAAQVINFMILLVLLKIFLFDKIKTAMDQRQTDIKQKFDTADEQKKEAEKALDDYREKTRSFE